MELDYFKDTKRKIDNLKNLKFIKNNAKINSLEMLKKYDFAIGKHSSILDEFLILNKPTIIYENPENVKPFINYGNKINCYSLKDLLTNVKLICNDFNRYNNSLTKSRKNLYFTFNKKKFFLNLNKIYNNYISK